jgi:hypothetical protein
VLTPCTVTTIFRLCENSTEHQRSLAPILFFWEAGSLSVTCSTPVSVHFLEVGLAASSISGDSARSVSSCYALNAHLPEQETRPRNRGSCFVVRSASPPWRRLADARRGVSADRRPCEGGEAMPFQPRLPHETTRGEATASSDMRRAPMAGARRRERR